MMCENPAILAKYTIYFIANFNIISENVFHGGRYELMFKDMIFSKFVFNLDSNLLKLFLYRFCHLACLFYFSCEGIILQHPSH